MNQSSRKQVSGHHFKPARVGAFGMFGHGVGGQGTHPASYLSNLATRSTSSNSANQSGAAAADGAASSRSAGRHSRVKVVVAAIRAAARGAVGVGIRTPILQRIPTADANRRLTVFRMLQVSGSQLEPCRHVPATEESVAQSDAQKGGCINNNMTPRRYKTDSGQGTMRCFRRRTP
jgi:hypothetical protein